MTNKNVLTVTLLLIVSAFAFQSCTKDQCTQTDTYYTYEPVYMSYDALRNSVASEGPRELKNPGKIYFYGQYILINEVNEGVHIIDNSDRRNPQNIAFINIPGNIDIAMKDYILYADNYIDLIAINMQDPLNATVTERVEDAFPQRRAPNGTVGDPSLGVVVDFEKTEVTEERDVPCNGNSGGWGLWPENVDGGGVVFNDQAGGLTSGAQFVTGQGGSMARFTLSKNFLYVVDQTTLHLYNVASPTMPVASGDVHLGWNIETIFPNGDHLYIGSRTGMHIYNNSNPASPSWVSTYSHVNACDPVVVQGDYAYVTLRDGTECETFTNQLDVVDISNKQSPFLVKSYDMHNPHGLGIDDEALFICEGDQGLKVFDAADVQNIDQHLLKHITTHHAYDVIPYNGLLFMIGDNGFVQYDYTDPANPEQLSVIPVSNE